MNKKHCFHYAAVAAMLFAANAQLTGQQPNIQTNLQQLIERSARAYIQPLAEGFTMNINGGWFHEAPPARTAALMVDVGVVGMFASVPVNQSFRVTGEYSLTPEQARRMLSRADGYNLLPQSAQNDIVRAVVARSLPVEITGPTAIGDKNTNVRIGLTANEAQRTFTTTVAGRNITVVLPANESVMLDVRGLLDTRDYLFNAVPFATPQLTVGTIMGTRGVIRYVPNLANWVGLGPLGEIQMFGWGVQHNPLTWFANDANALPINVALNYYTQSYTLTKAVRAQGTAYGVSASWTLGGSVFAITPYAGYILESASLNIDYEYQPRTATGEVALDVDGRPIAPVPIKFAVVGENTSRAIVGVSARILYLVDVGIEMNIGNRFSTVNINASVRLGNDLPQ
ncbi:MAG: hypothetical protein RML40_06730 [Bacteroidota bacterium]|nr:hypothetical protein [Candidatus Kapabacteria bacterium]MDW8220211.1 hypothetical protein [Bacteroidota bacterium]